MLIIFFTEENTRFKEKQKKNIKKIKKKQTKIHYKSIEKFTSTKNETKIT